MNEPISIVLAAESDALVTPILTRLLVPLGLEPVTARRWVQAGDIPIRRLFELTPLKGGVLSPRWGLSLSFVPHVSGRSVRWHRTAKSALFDLCFDPADAHAPPEFPGGCFMSQLHGALVLQRQAADILPRAASSAATFWNHVAGESDLLRLFEHLKRRATSRFGFYNYVQHPLAYAFTLARAGNAVRAIGEFEVYVSNSNCPDSALPRLRQLLALAGGSA